MQKIRKRKMSSSSSRIRTAADVGGKHVKNKGPLKMGLFLFSWIF